MERSLSPRDARRGQRELASWSSNFTTCEPRDHARDQLHGSIITIGRPGKKGRTRGPCWRELLAERRGLARPSGPAPGELRAVGASRSLIDASGARLRWVPGCAVPVWRGDTRSTCRSLRERDPATEFDPCAAAIGCRLPRGQLRNTNFHRRLEWRTAHAKRRGENAPRRPLRPEIVTWVARAASVTFTAQTVRPREPVRQLQRQPDRVAGAARGALSEVPGTPDWSGAC